MTAGDARRVILLGLSVGVSAGLVIWLFSQMSWSVLWSAVLDIGWGPLALSMGCVLAYMLLTALRWHAIIHRESPLDPLRVALNFLFANFLSAFTPGSVGSDAYRLYTLGRAGTNRWVLLGYLVQERFIGLLGFLLLLVLPATIYARAGAPGAAGNWAAEVALGGWALVAAVVAVFLGLFQFRGLVDRLPRDGRFGRLADTALHVRDRARFRDGFAFLRIAGFSAAILTLWCAAAQVLNLAAGADIPLTWLILLLSVTELSRFLPTSIQGIGVREATFVFGAGLIGAATEPAFVVVAVLYILNTLAQAMLGGVAVLGQHALGQATSSTTR